MLNYPASGTEQFAPFGHRQSGFVRGQGPSGRLQLIVVYGGPGCVQRLYAPGVQIQSGVVRGYDPSGHLHFGGFQGDLGFFPAGLLFCRMGTGRISAPYGGFRVGTGSGRTGFRSVRGGLPAVSGSRRRAFRIGFLVYEFDPGGDDCGALYQFLPEGEDVVVEEIAVTSPVSSARMAFQV